MYRNRRLALRSGLRAQGEAPPGADPKTGEISEPRHHLGKVQEAVLFNLFGARQYPRHHRPVKYGARLFKPYTSAAILTGLLVFMSIVILLGLAINGGDFCPGYAPP